MEIASSTRTAETGQDGKGLLRSQMWCPNNLALLYDRMEQTEEYYWLLELTPMVSRIRILIYLALPVYRIIIGYLDCHAKE